MSVLSSSSMFWVTLSYLAATLCTLGLAGFLLYTHRGKRIARVFILLLLAIVVWVFGSFARLFTVDPDMYVLVSVIRYIGVTATPVCIVVFALIYGRHDHWVRKRHVAALLLVPISTLVMVATNRFHHLFFRSFSVSYFGPLEVLTPVPGPWFWFNATYAWGLLLVGTTMLLLAALDKPPYYRRQTLIIVVAVSVSFITSIVDVFLGWPHPAVDATPISITITSLLFAVGVFSAKLMDIYPTARHLLVDRIDDGVVVMDGEGRVVDVNETMRHLLQDPSPIGKAIDAVLPDDLHPSNAADTPILEISTDGGVSFYRFSSVPIGQASDQGTLFVYTNVTPEIRTQRELETLHQLSGQLTSMDSFEDIFRRLVAEVQPLFGCEGCRIYEVGEDELHPVASSFDGQIERDVAIPLRDSILGEVFQRNEVYRIDDVQDTRTTAAQQSATGTSVYESGSMSNGDGPPDIEGWYRSVLYVPIAERCVLQLFAKSPAAFDEMDERIADLLATHLGAILSRIETEAQIRQQRNRLDEFTSVVSHDLRNPLGVANARVKLARDERESDHLEAVEGALERMEDLIDDLLTYAREGAQIDAMTSVDLSEVTRESWRNIQTDEATLRVDTTRRIRADRNRLQQLLENLMRNAIEHGGEDVTVQVGELADGFYVEDDGPGIPEAMREEVFERGYSMASTGTGLGLSIARQIVHAHGWKIAVTEGTDGGARFEITDVVFADLHG